MVQLDSRLASNIHTHMVNFQKALEKESKHRTIIARRILFLVEMRYMGRVPWEFWSDTTQSLPLPQVVVDFVRLWWGRLLRLLRILDTNNPMMQGTNLVTDQHPDVDEPTDRDIEEGIAIQYVDESQSAMIEEAENALAQELETLQAEKEAREFQNWENWVMETELSRLRTVLPRTGITLRAGSIGTGSASSSSSCLSAPVCLNITPPPVGQPLMISLQIENRETHI